MKITNIFERFIVLMWKCLKFIYSEKATKVCEISTLLLTGTTWDKSKVEISKNFVAFSENMKFNKLDFDMRRKIAYIPHRYLSFQVFHQLAEILDYVS